MSILNRQAHLRDWGDTWPDVRELQKSHHQRRLARLREPLFNDMESQVLVLPNLMFCAAFLLKMFPLCMN